VVREGGTKRERQYRRGEQGRRREGDTLVESGGIPNQGKQRGGPPPPYFFDLLVRNVVIDDIKFII
jgi:hypothetical protein